MERDSPARDDPAIIRVGNMENASSNTANFHSFSGLLQSDTGGDVTMAWASNFNIMGQSYQQCSTARTANNIRTRIEVKIGTGTDPSCINPTAEKVQPIVNLQNRVDEQITEKLFRGARMCKGDRVVNECVTMSVDPLNLSCLSCKTEHQFNLPPR